MQNFTTNCQDPFNTRSLATFSCDNTKWNATVNRHLCTYLSTDGTAPKVVPKIVHESFWHPSYWFSLPFCFLTKHAVN